MTRTLAILIVLLLPGPLIAGQHGPLKGSIGVGASIGRTSPRSPALSTGVTLGPTLGRLPSRGLGVAFGFNWFDADVDATFASTGTPLGRISVRPLMTGVGYTVVADRWAITPTFIGGVALTTVHVAEPLRDRYAVSGNAFEEHVGFVSGAFRAGTNVTYAVGPRLGLTAFAGYLWTRPTVTLSTTSGLFRRTLRADAAIADAGIVIALF